MLEVDEPFDLIMQGALTIRGRVVRIDERDGRQVLTIEMVPDDPRLQDARRASANARSSGESVLSLLSEPGSVWVHGDFVRQDGSHLDFGYIGRLSLAD